MKIFSISDNIDAFQREAGKKLEDLYVFLYGNINYYHNNEVNKKKRDLLNVLIEMEEIILTIKEEELT